MFPLPRLACELTIATRRITRRSRWAVRFSYRSPHGVRRARRQRLLYRTRTTSSPQIDRAGIQHATGRVLISTFPIARFQGVQ